MSLVITILTEKYVVQVSDTRLTGLEQLDPVSEEERKATIFQGDYARLAVGWVGFAWNKQRTHKTEQWLFEELRCSFGQPVQTLLPNLARKATSTFAGFSELPEQKRTSFIFAGWANLDSEPAAPLLACISNFEEKNGQSLPVAKEEFVVWGKRLRTGGHAIAISGAEDALPSTTLKDLNRLVKRSPSADSAMNAIVALMHKATAHTRGSKVIGKNWIAIEMSSGNPEAHSYFYPAEANQRSVFMPNIVGSGMAYRDIKVWKGSGRPPWFSS
jgi:hypothetical protein